MTALTAASRMQMCIKGQLERVERSKSWFSMLQAKKKLHV